MKAVIKADKLKEIMFRKGWTRRHLAKSAGISEVTAQQVCNGQRNPSPPVAKKIVDALGVEFEDIFEFSPVICSEQGA